MSDVTKAWAKDFGVPFEELGFDFDFLKSQNMNG
jgi:hypothetical protein